MGSFLAMAVLRAAKDSIGTHLTALLDVHLGAITRGLGGGLRRILRVPASASRGGRPDGGRHLLRSRGLRCWTNARHFQALPLACSVLSRELRRKGPVRWESRRGLTTSESCRVSNPATIGVLPPTSTPHTVGPALEYYSQYCQPFALERLTLGGEYCAVPDCYWRCARTRTSSAPLRWPTQPNRMHKQPRDAL